MIVGIINIQEYFVSLKHEETLIHLARVSKNKYLIPFNNLFIHV